MDSLQPTEYTFTNYYFRGVLNNDSNIDDNVCARAVRSNIKGGSPQFFIKMDGGEFFDPTSISPRYKKKLWKMRRVEYSVFIDYISFLGHPDSSKLGLKSVKYKAERKI